MDKDLLRHITDSDGMNCTSEELLASIISLSEPNIDSSRAASMLLKRFKTFAGAVNADLISLQQYGGISEYTARLIKLTAVYSRRYCTSVFTPEMRVFNTDSAYTMIKDHFTGRQHEFIALMILDRKGYVVFNDVIARCSFHVVPAYIKRIIRICLNYETDTVIIAHNHPGGSTIPTKEDIVAARKVQLALDSMYITVFDQLIISGSDYTSMKKSGLLRSISDETKAFSENLFYRSAVLEANSQVADFGHKIPEERDDGNDSYYEFTEGDPDEEGFEG